MDVHLGPVPQDQPQGPPEDQPEGPNAAANVPGDNEGDTLLSVHRDSNLRQFMFALDLGLFDSVQQLEIFIRDTFTTLYNLRGWRIPDDLTFVYSSQLFGGDTYTTGQAMVLEWQVFRQLIRYMVTDDYIFGRTVPFYRVLLTGMPRERGSVNIRPFDIVSAEQYMLTQMYSPEDGPPPLQHAFSYKLSLPGILGIYERPRDHVVNIPQEDVERGLQCVFCADIGPNINNNIGPNIDNAGEGGDGPPQGQQQEENAAANVPGVNEGDRLISVDLNSNVWRFLFMLDLMLFGSVQELEILIATACRCLYNLRGWRIPDDWTFVYSPGLLGGDRYTREQALELTWPAFCQLIRYVVMDDFFHARLVPFRRVFPSGETRFRGDVNVRPFDIDRAEHYMLARMYVQLDGEPPLPGPPLLHAFSYIFFSPGNQGHTELPRDDVVNNMPLEHVEQNLQAVLCRDMDLLYIQNINVNNIDWPEVVEFAGAVGDEVAEFAGAVGDEAAEFAGAEEEAESVGSS